MKIIQALYLMIYGLVYAIAGMLVLISMIWPLFAIFGIIAYGVITEIDWLIIVGEILLIALIGGVQYVHAMNKIHEVRRC